MTMIKHILAVLGRAVRSLTAEPAALAPALTEDDVASDRFLRRHPSAGARARRPAAL